MTVVVAAVGSSCAWMRGDLAVTDENGIQVEAGPKVYRMRWGLVGFSGSIRVAQVVLAELAQLAGDDDDLELSIPKTVGRALRSAGWEGSAVSELPSCEDLQLLIVLRNGRTLVMQGDLGTLAVDGARGYAIGSGTELALGALYASLEARVAPQTAVAVAVDAACRHVASCAWPGATLALELEQAGNL